MNLLISIVIAAVLLFLAVKILAGALRLLAWVVLALFVIAAANYLVLPRIDREPYELGLDGIFKDVKAKFRDRKEDYKEKLQEESEKTRDVIGEKIKEKIKE
jgi:hypothetical protein